MWRETLRYLNIGLPALCPCMTCSSKHSSFLGFSVKCLVHKLFRSWDMFSKNEKNS